MRNLRIILRNENREYVLNDPILKIDESLTDEEKFAHAKHVHDLNGVSCIMIAAMFSDLQKTFKNTLTYGMNLQLA